MEISVRLLGGLRAAVGERLVTISLPAGSTVADLLDALTARYPRLASFWPGTGADLVHCLTVVASGQEVAAHHRLRDGAEIWIMLPMSGGTAENGTGGMKVAGGWMGRTLHVDLTTGTHRVEELPADLLRRVIGGSGLGVHYLHKLTGPETDPLGPDNPLIMAVGPACGTRIPLSGRYVAVARSPLTGLYGEAESGSHFATGLKAAGYDALVLHGRAPAPCYLFIDDERVELRPAGHLWGQDAYATEVAVKAETDPKAGVACIGPAGERLVPMAGIMSDAPHGRAAARCGMGAVMGSKRLKAVAARGSHATRIADPERLSRALKQAFPGIVTQTAALKQYGTAGGTVANAVLGDMSARNWTLGDWVEPAERIGGEVMKQEITTGQYYCPACIIGCGREVRIETGPHAGTRGGGPEYETLAGFGAQVLVDDIRRIAEVNDWCNRYGMDTISVSGVIAFALEACERGLLSLDPDLPRAPLWGNPDLIVALVHKIAARSGVGDLLARGVRAAAAAIGGQAGHFAMHVKGLELPYHDPRALSSLAVGYASSPRGGCHRTCTHYMERHAFSELGVHAPQPRQQDAGKGSIAAVIQNYSELYQCLKLCQFQMTSIKATDTLEWFNALTGSEWELAELLRAGERVFNLKRLYNLRCGAGADQDTLPPRLLTQPFAAGQSAGYLPDLDTQLAEYYAARGWDPSGRPTAETLRALGLEEYAPAVPNPDTQGGKGHE